MGGDVWGGSYCQDQVAPSDGLAELFRQRLRLGPCRTLLKCSVLTENDSDVVRFS